MAVTTVRLSPQVEQELAAIATRTQRSKSWLVNRAVEEYIRRQQRDEDRWKQTLEAIESAANGNVVAAESVHDWIRGWGTDGEGAAPDTGP